MSEPIEPKRIKSKYVAAAVCSAMADRGLVDSAMDLKGRTKVFELEPSDGTVWDENPDGSGFVSLLFTNGQQFRVTITEELVPRPQHTFTRGGPGID